MVTSTQYQGVQVDSRYTPLKSLMQYIEGSSWTVNYYSQILDKSNENSAQQVDRNPIYQQYLLIHRLEVRIQQALVWTQDAESKEMEATGSALIGGGLIPNKGDMFIADAGDGRAGIFTITTAEKKSILKDSIYRVDYTLLGLVSQEKINDLNRKTIQEAYFIKDYLQFGQNPIVAAPDYENVIALREIYQRLVNQYFNDFFSYDFETLIVPDQSSPTYDPFLTKSLLDWVATDEHPLIPRIRKPNVYSEPVMRSQTIWDAITRMTHTHLPACVRKMGLVDVRAFIGAAEFGGVYYNGIERVVYPLEGRTDGDRGHGLAALSVGTRLSNGRYRWGDINRRVVTNVLSGFDYLPKLNNDIPDIVSVNSLDTYLFSESFYINKGPFSSKLEVLLSDALNGRNFDGVLLRQIAEGTDRWSSLERFYFIPVLIALLKVRIRKN